MCKPALCFYLTLMHKFQFTSHERQCVINNTNHYKHSKTFYFILNAKKPQRC